ncbi:retron Se72 family effector protein [Photobacterium iliopiscarium]|uniref:retron Se72 family effector protein n=1 Tax=Photobacterium iliopiscarium TaxID=56192 RepID=UPI0005D3BCBF|nr:retron Se72 family effector protein [Photobacterium iliopiscarium]KJG11968.1 hypothetical protein UB38_18295 [Photobacterium iliopiscarium]PST96828.1 cold-shock protein [Photobacterium iliopiscarium]PSV79024.1 cold-shock protein [Photobacterium iliopiscarium]
MELDLGIINAFNSFKGIGFIRREKGKDVFFSIDDIEQDIDIIKLGAKVSFSIIKTKKGLNAKNIIIK